MKRERRNQRRAKGKYWLGVSMAALFAALFVFAVLLQIEEKSLKPYEKGQVFVTVKPLPKGTVLSKENWGQYVAPRELELGSIPSGAVTAPEWFDQKSAVFSMEQGVFLTEGMFCPYREMAGNPEEMTVLGVKTEDVSQMVCGILRGGDRVHIFCVESDGSVSPVQEYVYIQQVFDAAGNRIANEDVTTPAQRINICLDKKQVEAFYQQMAKGALKIVKVEE